MTRLPGWSYDGPDPDGFMTAPEVVSFFGRYAASFDAPVQEHTTILASGSTATASSSTTDEGPFRSDHVVIATGWCDRPAMPTMAGNLAGRVHQLVPSDYRKPDDAPALAASWWSAHPPPASSSPTELQAAGREVTLAVGSHSRLPRHLPGHGTSSGGST